MRLTLEQIGYTYAPGTDYGVRALAGVDLSVSQGQIVLVLGATGSGKSTLLRVAAGLQQPTEGTVHLDGVPLDTPSNVAGRIGMVFQSPESQLFADTVEADVAFGPRNMGAGADDARIAARTALERVGLDPDMFGGRSPFALSGGEAHRVAIAGVLAMSPEILLFDEPTAGLDAQGRRCVSSIVAGARESAGVVVVTHDAEEFLGMADHVLLLAGGQAAFAGHPQRLIEEPTRFEAAGLLVPEVLRTQVLVGESGLELGSYSLDPRRAAALIADARGAAR